MAQIKFTNENGNVSVKVRDGVRSQVNEKFLSVMQANFDGVEVNADKQVCLPIATDELTGEPIYAVFSVTVTMKDQTKKTERKKKAKATTETAIPTIW